MREPEVVRGTAGEFEPPLPPAAGPSMAAAPRHGDTIATLMHAAAARSVVDSLTACIMSVPTGHLVSSGQDMVGNASAESLQSLQRCITQYAHTMRALGEPPGGVLVMLEAVLHDALPAWLSVDAFRPLAIMWCAQAMRAPG